MDLFLWLLGFVLLALLALILLGDADLSLLFAEQWGSPLADLADQVVWITGASSGIGEYLAYELAKHSCKIVLSARRTEELERVKNQCIAGTSISADRILVLPMDVTDKLKHKVLFQQVLDHFGKLDILVNNAGRTQRSAWEKPDIQVDEQLFDLNVFSAVNLTRVVLPHFLERKAGHVAVVGSIAGKIGAPMSGVYSGAKHALHGYFDALRFEKSESNLSVTMICPGPVISNILPHSFTDKPNEEYGKNWGSVDQRMATERCATLCAVSIANKMDEVWISRQPFLILTYMFQYCPYIARKIFTLIGLTRISKMRDGTDLDKNQAKEN